MSLISPEMLGLIAPAFCAGLVTALTHVPLGQEVLRRGIIFIDLAIAQIAALGVVVGAVVFQVQGIFVSFFMALVFALAGGALFSLLEKKAVKHQEAFIGCAFIVSASLIMLLFAGDPHGGEQMRGLLAGQILWVSWKQVLVTAGIYVLILVIWFRFRRSGQFYILLPVAVTLSVQLVGVYLVFTSLIVPALATGAFTGKKRLLVGYIIAAVAVVTGLGFSVLSDLPAGPVIVCAYAIVAAVFVLIYARIMRAASTAP